MTDKEAADAAAEVDLAHSRRAVVVGAVRHIVERFFNLVHSRTSLMRVRDIFTQCDADGDGRVTREEFGRALTRLRVFLTAEELEACWPRLDVDGNGTLSPAEFEAVVRGFANQPRPTVLDLYEEGGPGSVRVAMARVTDHAAASGVVPEAARLLLAGMTEVQKSTALRILEEGGRLAK